MKETKICVIGLGYVGLPLARLFSTKYPTVGFDMNQKRCDALMAGHDATLEVADDIEEIKSYCGCGKRKAIINARFDENGEIITKGSQVEIGGNDKYVAICRKCFKDKVRNKINKKENIKL